MVEPGCENNDIDHSAAVARAAFEGSPRILTYVIGIGEAIAGLDTIANAGGTGMAIIVPLGDPTQTKQTFQDELAGIRTLNLSCDIEIPPPPPTEALDPALVNVAYTDSDGQTIIAKYWSDNTVGLPDSTTRSQ